jgi:hypothetical protein
LLLLHSRNFSTKLLIILINDNVSNVNHFYRVQLNFLANSERSMICILGIAPGSASKISPAHDLPRQTDGADGLCVAISCLPIG